MFRREHASSPAPLESNIDDSVLNEFGSIEEITSTYVVIRLWDLRRMIVPLMMTPSIMGKLELMIVRSESIGLDLLMGTVAFSDDFRRFSSPRCPRSPTLVPHCAQLPHMPMLGATARAR
jgi:hypothetical protein